MKRGIMPRSTFRVAFFFALIFCLGSSQVALAEYYSVFGGAGYVRTDNFYLETGTYKADSRSYDSYADETMIITSRGYNNAGNPTVNYGWHHTGSGGCNEPSPGYCDATTPADGQGSGSTDKYVTAEHYFIWGWGSEYHYTSTGGTRSSWNCLVTPGC